MKIPMAVASAVLLASTLASCNGSDSGGDGDRGGSGSSASGDYCKDLKQAVTKYGGLSSGDYKKLDEALATFHEIADEAPGEVKDEWKELDGTLTSIEKALKDAGLTFSEIAEMQSGKIPEGVDASKLQGLAKDMSKLSSAEATKASAAIEAHAKKACKVDFKGL